MSDPEEVTRLIEAVDGFAQRVDALTTAQLEMANAQIDDRRFVRRLSWPVLFDIVLSVILGITLLQLQHTNSEQRAATHERLIATCQQTNDFYMRHDALVTEDEQTLRIALEKNDSPVARDFFNGRIAAYENTKAELRDCSDAGIARYYSTTTTTTKGR